MITIDTPLNTYQVVLRNSRRWAMASSPDYAYIFEQSYASGVLGIEVPLNESQPYANELREQIIQEQLRFEDWWGDDRHLFERAYGKLLEEHGADELLSRLDEGPITDFGKALFRKGVEKVEQGIEGAKDALLSAKEGIKKFGEQAWNIMSAMWLVMKGGGSGIAKWTGSIFKKAIQKKKHLITTALEWMAAKFPDWGMPTFANWAQKALDFVNEMWEKITGLEGWTRAIGYAGLAVGLQYLWNKVGSWIEELKKKVGDLDPRQQLKDAILDPIKEWLKKTAKEMLESIFGDAFKAVLNTLTSAVSGVKIWWDTAVKVVGGAQLVVAALGDAADRTMLRFRRDVDRVAEAKGNTRGDMSMKTGKMKVTKNQLRLMIEECQMGAGPEVGDAQPAPEMPCPISTAKKLRAAGATGPEILTWVKQLFSTLVEADEAPEPPEPVEKEKFAFTGDVGELEPTAAFGVGYEAGSHGLE